MAFSQIATSVTIISSGLKGYQAVSLTNFSVSAESSIAAGSAVEISNAFFLNASDLAVTGFSAITTGNTCYIALTPAGSAGSQTLSAAWTETAPTWRDDAQGWYASAASTVRYVAGTTKTSASGAEPDFILPNIQADTTGGTTRILGDFDVDGIARIPLSEHIGNTNTYIDESFANATAMSTWLAARGATSGKYYSFSGVFEWTSGGFSGYKYGVVGIRYYAANACAALITWIDDTAFSTGFAVLSIASSDACRLRGLF